MKAVRSLLVVGSLLLSLTPSGRLAEATPQPEGTRYPAPPGVAASPSALAAHSRLSLHVLWSRAIRPNADSTPVYVPQVALPGRKHRAMIYLLAGNNSSNCDSGDPVPRATLYALDAATGAVRWTRSTRGPARCTTAAPAVVNGWVYVPGLDGKVRRYHAGTGKEYRRGGWPRAYTLMPDVEKASANLTVDGRYLYVTTSGYIGDQGHYEGHLVTFDLHTGEERVFNSLCSNTRQFLGPTPGAANYCQSQGSGLFGHGQAVTDPVNHDVYIVSGNGPWNGRTDWGDSVMKLDPSGANLLDTFTPTNQAQLDYGDLDLGSTGPAILPPIHQGGRAYYLLVQGGKGPACYSCNGTVLRLLDRNDLSGQHGLGHLGGDLQDIATPGGCEVLTAPAVWTARSGAVWVFYANDCGMAGYRISTAGAAPRLTRVWALSQGGSTPVTSGGVLYDARSGHLTAYDPTSGAVLWRGPIGDLHWEYPAVGGHRLYIADENGHVTAYGISG